MIRRLRRKLIAACMASLALVLTVILGGVNLMGYSRAVADADAVLTVLGDNGGMFPKTHGQEAPPEGGDAPDEPPGGKKELFGPRAMSPETPYESRFFWVLLGEDGQVLQTDTGQIAAVDAEDAAAYARSVAGAGSRSGFWGDYRYLLCEDELGSRVIFLDCGRSLSDFRATLRASVMLAAAGLLAVLALRLEKQGRWLLLSVSNTVDEPVERRVLAHLLYHLGRWIYLVDALDDLKRDAESGNYNPISLRFSLEHGTLTGPARAAMVSTLDASIRQMAAAYELGDFGEWSPLIRSTVYEGLYCVGNAVLEGTFRTAESRRGLCGKKEQV